ncbi:ADP-ribosyltransferase, partial [Brucella intermedia]|uniref:ADP-ribosyltransferase n=2 Tax=Brucella/Ochrobactrum group TaxID=2826938 RepID=UPI001AECFD76
MNEKGNVVRRLSRIAVRTASVLLALSAAGLSSAGMAEVRNHTANEAIFSLEPKPWMKGPTDDDFDDLPLEEKRIKALAEISQGIRDVTQEGRIKAADAYWDSYMVNLPDAQMDEFYEYTMSARNNSPLRKGTQKYSEKNMRKFLRSVSNTDWGLYGRPADAAYIVSRGTDLRLSPEQIKTLRGRTITDKAYLSTTLMDKPPRIFDKGNVILRVRVPQGAPSAYLNNTAAVTGFMDQEELLLGRDTAINVTRSFCGTPDASVEGGCKQWEVFGEVVLRQVQLTVETSGDAGVKGHVVF